MAAFYAEPQATSTVFPKRFAIGGKTLTSASMAEPAILSDRAVIRLTGDDRRSFLQGIITQDMDRLSAGGAIFSALLTPQGKILFDFFVVEDGEAFLIDCHRDAAAALLKRLTLYKLRAKVAIELDNSQMVVVCADNITIGRSFPDPRHESLGWRAIAPRHDALAASSDYEDRRITLGVPEAEKDFTGDEMFLLDVNYDALQAVSYKKGCFVGQEVTSRMKRKGDVRRRTLVAVFSGPPPEKGSTITAGESVLGTLLSGVGVKALALIRLGRWEKARTSGVTVLCNDHELQLTLPAYLEQA